jgi:integrase
MRERKLSKNKLYPRIVPRNFRMVNAEAQETTAGADSNKAGKNNHFSKNGKWKSFPKVPNLLQYVSTGTYFARVKVNGKVIRQSLGTGVFTTAKEKLPDFLKKQQSTIQIEGSFGDALAKYRADLELDAVLSEATKRYRRNCVATILKHWPDVGRVQLRDLKAEKCKDWAKRVAGAVDEQYFNNILGTFKKILRIGGLEGAGDPTREIKRLGVKAKVLKLPTSEQFKKLVSALERSSAWKARDAAVVIKFLAYSGCRISEAGKVTWADVDLEHGFIRVQNAKLRNSSNHSLTREVPIVPEMKALLLLLKEENPSPTAKVLPFDDVEKSLTTACSELKIDRITHHDLRHMFATRALQSGVDVATIAGWLGHKDGGALVLKTYSHFQREHSQAMAAKVKF